MNYASQQSIEQQPCLVLVEPINEADEAPEQLHTLNQVIEAARFKHEEKLIATSRLIGRLGYIRSID